MTMNKTQQVEHLEWALDSMDDGDLATAVDHINRVLRDLKPEAEHEADVHRHLRAADKMGA